MQLEDLKRRARELQPGLAPDTVQRFRGDLVAFLAQVPEPPVYRRRDDPVREQAVALLEAAVPLLARAELLGAEAASLGEALDAALLALGLLAENRVEAAEPAWRRARALERAARSELRLWRRSDEGPTPVWDAATGRSRFDPRPEAQVHATLACPACRKVGEFSFSPRLSQHDFQCAHCAYPFQAFFGEVRGLEVRPLGGRRRRYLFRLEALAGAQARVDFDDGSGEELAAARGDLMAFVYAPPGRLRGVLNLNTSRVLWLPGGPCFVATVAFGGEAAPELELLRGFRDRHLAPRAAGRAFIAWYYRAGPGLAQGLAARPRARGAVRAALRVVVRALEQGGQR